ncbi:hypothetical protein PINS_up004854 [Pythium insidiosum]|nr:hypothetical protein PINS_up004854 [Pythium insidiosum]
MDEDNIYRLHEDSMASKHRLSDSQRQPSPLMQRPVRSSSSYQPPLPPGVKAIDIASPSPTTRLLDRDPLLKRSWGRWNIRRDKVEHYWKLYLQDPFHTLVHMRLAKVLAVLLALYLAALFIFAGLYLTVPTEECRTSIQTFHDSFSFSVSVFFTIGFGTNGGDVFFGECAWMQTIITMESLVSVFLEAVALGITFQRIARAQSRANTVVLSHTAVVRRIRGHLYFMFQVCEMRKHQLVEGHVRMYAVRHDVEYGQHYYFQSYPMRIQHPDDELGGMLLLALPSVVVHRIDPWSPLLRPKSALSCGLHHNAATSYMFPDVQVRGIDLDNGDRDRSIPVDTTVNRICNRCRCTEPDAAAAAASEEPTHESQIQDIINFWNESQLEIVVLLEGIDAVTSATIQVRHSYKIEDILFDHRFENCVDVDPATGGAVVDFKRFHQTRPVDPECVKVAGAFY